MEGYLANAHISSESRPPLIIITSLHLKYVSAYHLSCVCDTMVISYQYTQVFMCYNSEKLYRYQCQWSDSNTQTFRLICFQNSLLITICIRWQTMCLLYSDNMVVSLVSYRTSSDVAKKSFTLLLAISKSS